MGLREMMEAAERGEPLYVFSPRRGDWVNVNPQKRRKLCVTDQLSPHGPATVRCHHGHEWQEGDPFGVACQPCCEGTCEAVHA